jgi:hypothetical protein
VIKIKPKRKQNSIERKAKFVQKQQIQQKIKELKNKLFLEETTFNNLSKEDYGTSYYLQSLMEINKLKNKIKGLQNQLKN